MAKPRVTVTLEGGRFPYVVTILEGGRRTVYKHATRASAEAHAEDIRAMNYAEDRA